MLIARKGKKWHRIPDERRKVYEKLGYTIEEFKKPEEKATTKRTTRKAE